MKLHHRLIALLLVLMLLVCAGCSAKDDGVKGTTAAKTTAVTTTAVKQTTPLITLPATTTLMQTTTATTKATITTTTQATTAAAQTTTTQATTNNSEPDAVERARALLTEVYESRVFDDSLDLTQNPGLLSQRDFTGPFLCGHLGYNALRYCPKVYRIEDLDPALPEDVLFLEAQREDLPRDLVNLLITPEKEEMLAEGRGMFAVLEYTGYGNAGDYGSFKLYYHRTRISFYDFETGEMQGWIDTTRSRSGPLVLNSSDHGYDGNHEILLSNGDLYNEPPLWEKALNKLFYDENGYQVVGTRLLSLPADLTEMELASMPEAPDPIVIPEGVTRIGDRVGENLAALELILPDGLEYIGKDAFRDSFLETVSFPDSVRYIDKGSFRDTYWMKHAAVDGYVIVGDGILLYADPEGDEITLPPEVRYVMPGALDDLRCSKLTIPETVVQLCGQDYNSPVVLSNNTLETLVLRGGLREALDFPEVSVVVASWCKNLKTVVIDCDTDELPENWLYVRDDMTEQLTVYCKEGSPAEAWAKEKGIRVLPLSEYDGD